MNSNPTLSRTSRSPLHCTFCMRELVDRAIARAGIAIKSDERFRLIAALLGRRHLVLSGSDSHALNALVHALGEELADQREDDLCVLPGHPWWAAGTERCGYFAKMNESVAMWRLCYFLADALPETLPRDCARQRVICVQNMSPAEVEYYYEFLARQLASMPELAQSQVALVGAYPGNTPPSLSPEALRRTGVVHLGQERQPGEHRRDRQEGGAPHSALLLHFEPDLRRPSAKCRPTHLA